ncbi:MAG TPA: hypothetical protein VNZ64_18715 [Candidatus Acidoferrum sp.]|jgi:hypothetical protein|nr:hypothetical protein [Candidatus Acidoferrum sp.]
MNPYYNLPPEKRFTQRLVDQFNADERLWETLEPRRKARRKRRPRLSRKRLKKLGLAEFAKARPPQDCIGQWIETSRTVPAICR